MAREKMEIDDECKECKSFHHHPATYCNSRGDPGDPEENNCDYDWICPYLDDCEHFDEGVCCKDGEACDEQCEEHDPLEDEDDTVCEG